MQTVRLLLSLAPLIYEGGRPEGAGGSPYHNKNIYSPRPRYASATPLINEGGQEKIRLLLQPDFLFYRTKEVDRVVDQLSPGFRTAAAGFSFQFLLPPSGLGRLCQGSMQTNFGIPGLDQIRQ